MHMNETSRTNLMNGYTKGGTNSLGPCSEACVAGGTFWCVYFAVGQNLFRTCNLIGSCWPEALLFQSWGSLLVLFGLGLSIVF